MESRMNECECALCTTQVDPGEEFCAYHISLGQRNKRLPNKQLATAARSSGKACCSKQHAESEEDESSSDEDDYVAWRDLRRNKHGRILCIGAKNTCKSISRGASKRCSRHKGGPRCQEEGCKKGAVGGFTHCRKHGGGARCSYEDGGLRCRKGAQRGTRYCIAHGGGRRCLKYGCNRAANHGVGEWKWCIAHSRDDD